MKVLVYTRRRVRKFYHALADQLFSGYEVVYFSDDKYCENNYIMSRFNLLMKTEIEIVELSDNDYYDIINRCRFLRSKEYKIAYKMVSTMWYVLRELIEEHQVRLGFGLCVDNYVLDIYQKLLNIKNGKYISFVPTALNNYSRITQRGELIKLRKVHDDEVNKALKMILDKTYKPWYVQEGAAHIKNNLLPFYLKDKFKLTVFKFLSVLENNKNGFYYGSHFLKEPMMICNRIENCNPYKYFDYDWRLNLKKKVDNKIVYIPLQFYPECSTDYWNEELFFTRYYELLFSQLAQMEDESITVLIKEHPIALGYRAINIYEKVKSYNNVILIPHDVPSSELIELSDCVITGGTSTAVEAFCKGILVATNGKIVYDQSGYFTIITEEIMRNKRLKSFILEKINKHDKPKIFEFIKELLESSLEFNFNPLITVDDCSEVKFISNAVEPYINY